ncbi:hypothetical protein ES705_48349 [subsurface metagenome]
MLDLERIFDLAVHMNWNPGEDYIFDKEKGVMLNYPAQGEVLNKSIQAFMQGVGTKLEDDKVIQAWAGSSALPRLTKDVFNVTQAVPVYDLLWQAAFRGIPLKKGELSWEIADVSSGLTYKLIPEGGKADFYSLSGNKEVVSVWKYGAGLGITWETIEGRKLYAFVDQMLQARARLYELWANTHYALLDAAAVTAGATGWAGVATDPVLDRDIATINLAYEFIGNACKAKGYGDMANVQMLLFALPSRKARIMQALRATSSDMTRGRATSAAGSFAGQVIEYNITPYFTWNAAITAATPIMVLPGNKIQNAMYMQELGLKEKDIETLSELQTYWTAFGAAIGDTDQFRHVTLT